MRLTKALLLTSALGLGTPALAEATSGPAVNAFEGAYAGLGLGAATASGTTDYPVLSGGTVYAPFDPGTGKVLSAFFGYNFQRGDVVYGAEARYINLVRLADRDPATPEDREVMDMADIRGRVGYVMGDLMVYGAVGWSWAQFRVHPGSGFGARPNQTSLTGLNLGLGLEYNLSERWRVSGDFTYRDLNGKFEEAVQDTDLKVSTLSVQLAYRF
ncbi:outer membrane protein [Primorskyibacter sp. S87]|uniref:outer membrane protein n=1 Tax=Primorskyibacter sp. S87 TaxID=3415126 RepID=UPI003C7A1EF8